MTTPQDSHKSFGPALGGLVALLVVIMIVVFTGFNLRDRHLEDMLHASDLSESVIALERQLTDGYRYLSLSSDDLFDSQQGMEVDIFVLDFKRRLSSLEDQNESMRAFSSLVGIEAGIQVSRRVEDLSQSWNRVIENVLDNPTDATVELITVSDPLSVDLLSLELPSLVADIHKIQRQTTDNYDRVSGLVFVIILIVFLAAYMVALVLISHILGVQKERQAIEAELRTAMEQANAASYEKSRFLSNMSHELRTPMNGVIGMANVLSSKTLPDDHRRLVTVLKESADSALALINDILDFEAIEAGKVTVEERVFEIADVTRRIQFMASAQLMDKPVDFSISVDTDLPRRVRGDEARLVQVLTNLVSNAIKFTEVGSVDVLIQQEMQSFVSFTVRDSGIGIDVDRIDALFESFRQADNSIRRRYGGTGLGLSITRSLVHMMGGTITVSSTPGQGSTFVITLPLAAVTSPCEPSTKTPRQQVYDETKRLSILCVDDNPVNLEVAHVVIEEAGHVCILASSGEEGLLHLSREDVDVVLMDCHMDGLDGFETAKRMIESHPGVPIVALTADATTSAVKASQEAGMCDVLTKPFKPEVLIAMIERLGRSQFAKEGGPSTNRRSVFMGT